MLDGILLRDLPGEHSEATNSDAIPLAVLWACQPTTAHIESSTNDLCSLSEDMRVFCFAGCASVELEVPTAPRRSNRARTQSVRLQPLGTQPVGVTPPFSSPFTTGHVTNAPAGRTSAVPASAKDDLATRPARTDSAIDRALQSLTNTPDLVKKQIDDHVLGEVRAALLRGDATDGERYSVDDQELMWYSNLVGKMVLAVPRCLVPEVLALVHSLHGHAGVASTLALVRERFYWPSIARDTKEYVLSCGCRRRKRSNSQKTAMMPGHPVEPWEVLEMDLLKMGATSLAGNSHLLLVVDKGSKFPFAFPIPSKEAEGVARHLLQLCLMFGVPHAVRTDGGGEFNSTVVKHLCRWLHADIDFGPADHSRAQGAVERLGGWMQEVLAELCTAWPDRWDEYVSPACWIKRTLPDPTLPSSMTPFELLFGRSPRTSLDTLVPRLDDTESTRGLENFVERRRQNLREVRLALEKRHETKVVARRRANARISRPSAGVRAETGDLVLVREADSTTYREGLGKKLLHEKWTGPWRVDEVVQRGLSVVVVMQGRKIRKRTVSTAWLKPFHVRPLHLRHTIADEFAQYAWKVDFGLTAPSTVAHPFYTLVNRKEVTSDTGVIRWEYRGRYQNGTESTWVSESEALDSFTPLQLDVFHALWTLYHPETSPATGSVSKKRPAPLSRSDALGLFPIGTPVYRCFDHGAEMVGQVYDYLQPYWRVRYPDNNWEEMPRRDLERSTKKPR